MSIHDSEDTRGDPHPQYNRKSVVSPSDSVRTMQAFGLAPVVGVATTYSRGDHGHGTAPLPAGGHPGQVMTFNGATWNAEDLPVNEYWAVNSVYVTATIMDPATILGYGTWSSTVVGSFYFWTRTA